ncbi:HAMP domain-containing sensor histidine kinase [Sulfitobacter sp. G21635-S1]|uniref:sensor histidine kinase n=1 Tax=Sulfitobacter sp. G21635-S1 TaxID=3014043 RepID=UPI0022AF1FF9|nr:HAMP domain-containing sensor histidine kinase [Sulfitobacter sp. G21635-S1]MCZ4257609.1 HAMP domain-containing sensor histidine kinase [Sulfitobacter sp. G21635-S1]
MPLIPPRHSLLRSLLTALALPGIVAVLIGCVIVYSLVKEEYDELLDLSLSNKAQLLLQIRELSGTQANASFEETGLAPEERVRFWFLDADGAVTDRSALAEPLAFSTADLPPKRITSLNGFRVILLASDVVPGLRIVVAEPLVERNEALFDVMSAVVLGFFLLGGLSYAAAYLSVRRSAGMVTALSADIARKSEHDLSPISRKHAFAEIEPAINTLDRLMARLDTALEAERAFATNAAHELRTPVAIAMAQAQRLKAMARDPALAARAGEIETGLKRLVRLIERLLQMSRAQSGLGRNAPVTDIAPVIDMLLRELRGSVAEPDKLILQPTTAPWPCRLDPDALGIILNNLFDNALKHGSGPVTVNAATPEQIAIANECDRLSAAEVAMIKRRFGRRAPTTEGFGLGLTIVQELCSQSGCGFDIRSPRPGSDSGVLVTVTFPVECREPLT